MIKAHRDLDSATICNALFDVELDPNAAIIDLSRTEFVSPAGLVAVATLADQATRSGKTINWIGPRAPSPRNYLARMHLGEILESLGIEHNLPAVQETPLEDTLLELRTFSTESDGEALANLVFEKATNAIESGSPNAHVLHEGICELAGNVCFHARVDHGFAAAQTYQGSIVFAVGDGGVGIKQSLESTHQPASAREALELAITYGVSGTGEQGRGSGLHYVLESVTAGSGRFTRHCHVKQNGRCRPSHQPHASHVSWGFTRTHWLRSPPDRLT